MKLVSKIEKIISNFYFGKRSEVKTTSELDKRIIDDALPAYEQSLKTQSASIQPNIWRIIMRSKIVKLTAAAIILLAVILGINYTGTSIDGASTAFAAAMDSIKQARTFSCIEIFEMSSHDDEKEGKYLFKQKWMFKEPNLERHEALTSLSEEYKGEITIWDYDKRQMLNLRPFEKKAALHDLSFSYGINDKTGQLELTKLDTSLRDHLLELSMGTFNDLGNVELDGKSVFKLESEKKGRVTTVWIDPKTNYPVQIEHKWPNQKRSPILYTSIQIDTELNDELFSLKPPEGYEFSVFSGAWPIDKSKLGTKIMHLGMLCLVYANKNNDKFPDKFEDLVTSGVTNEYALRNILAAPDDPIGTPIFLYRKPDLKTLGTDDMSIEVMIYEDYEGKPANEQVVVTMLDSHSELLLVQTLKELLKPWPSNQKKLVIKMTNLHWGCLHFAQENNGKYPKELKEIAGGKFSEDTIKRLLAAPGQQDGPAVIQYRPLPYDAEPSTEVMFYEVYDTWPEDGIVVCYGDGQCEIIKDQKKFEEMIK